MKDERLEYLSDQVRKGIPLDFAEALEVIEYQSSMRGKKKSSPWRKCLDWIKVTLSGTTTDTN